MMKTAIFPINVHNISNIMDDWGTCRENAIEFRVTVCGQLPENSWKWKNKL